MTNLETIAETFQGLLAQACLSALLAMVVVFAAVKILKSTRAAFSGLWRKSRMGLAAVAILSLTMMLWGDKTNLLRQVIHPASRGGTPALAVSGDDILRGYRQEVVTTNETPFCEMPTNAVEYAPWRLRGGRETDFPLSLGDFAFPYGTNIINRFRVLSGGMIETYPALNGSASICAAREYASLVPGVSRFWSADANGGAKKVLRWESVFVNRNRTGEYSAEIRLSANGDFTTRSNALETVYRRVNPHDLDGDGLANEIDADPTMSNGDCFGTGVGWLNANCVGVLSAATNGLGEMEISWRTNANPNAYYWLDLTATGALGVAKITATCDGESSLGDLAVIARTNEVCRIPLLVGATYIVESDLPIAHSAVSSEHANIFTNSEHSLIVSLPIEFSYEPMRAAASFRLVSLPVDVNAMLVSVLGGCCSCRTNDVGFTWSCSDGCPCGGGVGHMLSSSVTWQGYSSLFTGWQMCPCPSVVTPEGGQGDSSPKLVLDSPHVYFTNMGGRAEPSDVVHVKVGLAAPVATNGTMRLEVDYPECVNVWANSNRTCAVSLPMEWDVSTMAQRSIYVEGADAVLFNAFSLAWRDADNQVLLSTNIDFGVHCPILDVINSADTDHGDLCNPVGIVTGTNACFALGFHGQAPIPADIKWSIVEGDAWFVNGENMGERVRVASDLSGQRITLRAQIGDCRSRPPEISAYVVDPMRVKLTVWIVGDDFGTYYPIEEPAVSNMVAYANKAFEQLGVSFFIDTLSYTNHYDWLDISSNNVQNLVLRRELVNITKNSNGLEIYFIDTIGGKIKANNDLYGIVVSKNWSIDTLAHEIGHSFGCADVYPTRWDNTRIGLPDNRPKKSHAPDDWNNGDGCRYYQPDITQTQLIERMLMCGYGGGTRGDITAGMVYGFNRTNECDMVDTGFIKNDFRRNLRLHR